MSIEDLMKLYGGAFTEEAIEDDSFIKVAKKGGVEGAVGEGCSFLFSNMHAHLAPVLYF